MDWAKAIAINHAALTRIVLGLIAMVGIADGKAAVLLPRSVCLAVARVLRPAESAVRRLIVIAARGLVVKPMASRPMPKGLAIKGKGGGGRISFPLFDTPKRYGFMRRRYAKFPPRIHVIEFVQVFQPKDFKGPPAAPVPDGATDAQRLVRRLAAVKMALETLPKQALRLARWKARRDKTPGATRKSPLRLGTPPGFRSRSKDEIDFVLKECHALAFDALKVDTS